MFNQLLSSKLYNCLVAFSIDLDLYYMVVESYHYYLSPVLVPHRPGTLLVSGQNIMFGWECQGLRPRNALSNLSEPFRLTPGPHVGQVASVHIPVSCCHLFCAVSSMFQEGCRFNVAFHWYCSDFCGKSNSQGCSSNHQALSEYSK